MAFRNLHALLARVAVVAFAGVSLAPSLAQAQSPEDRASARALAADADTKVAAGDYAGAVDSFTKAYAFVPAPTIKLARGRAYANLGKLVEAQQDFADAARSEAHPGEPAPFGEARRKAAAEAEAITARVPLLTLTVTGAPAAKVSLVVDGQASPLPTVDGPRAVNPGTHSVRAEADGFGPIEQVVTILEGERKTLTFPLHEVQLAAPVVAPPPAPAPYAPGTYPGQTYPGQQVSPFTLPPPAPRPNNTLSTLGWVGTGVFAGTGIVTGLVAIVQADDVKKQCLGNACPSSAQGEANSSSTLGWVSTVTFIAAGGCLLVGILAHHSAPSQTAGGPSFDVTLGPGSIGAVGRF